MPILCPLFTQRMRSSRIILASLSVHDKKEAMEAIITEGKVVVPSNRETFKGNQASRVASRSNIIVNTMIIIQFTALN